MPPDPASTAAAAAVVVNRQPSERRRAVVAGIAGVLVGGVGALGAPWQAAVLARWDVAAFVLVVWIASAVRPLDAAQTASLATREDDSRAATRLILVAAAVISLSGWVLRSSRRTISPGGSRSR